MSQGSPPRFPMPRRTPLDPPPELLERMADEPIFRATLQNGDEAWVITKFDAARDFLASSTVSADVRKPGYPRVSESLATYTDGLLNHMDPPEHDDYRRMLAPEFMVKRVERLRPDVEAIVESLADAMLAKGPPADLVADFAFPIPARMICALLGVPFEDSDFFVACAETFLSDSVTADQSSAALANLNRYIGELIDQKALDPTDDVLGYMCSQHLLTGAITRDALVMIAQMILIAGFDTTANMIALGVLTLLQHPEQRDLLAEDPSLVPDAVDELLRYLTITHWGRHRTATADIVVHGHLIRAGEGVIVAQNAANRDPDEFDDPDTFAIGRSARRHLAFGHGVHQCLGASFARLEMTAAFTTILSRFPTLELTVPMSHLRFKEHSAVYGLVDMPVKW